MSFPPTVPTTGIADGGRFQITSASLPPSVMDSVPVFYFGRSTKVNGDRTYPDWNITVINDEDFSLRSAFETWHNSINAAVSNRMDPAVAGPLSSISTYKVDILVQQLSKPGPPSESGVLKSYRLIGAFPTVVSPINLDWRDVNRVEMFDVTLSYDYWINDIGIDGGFNPVLPPDGSGAGV